MLKVRFFKALTVAFLLLSFVNSVFAIDIYYKNKIVPTDTKPVVENGRTLVPISAVAKSIGAEVSWDEETKTVSIKKEGVILYLVIGSKDVEVSNPVTEYMIEIDVAPKIINGRTMVPIRAIAEFFDSEVSWDKSTNSILIDSDPPKASSSDTSASKSIEKAILNSLKDYSYIYYSVDSIDELKVELVKEIYDLENLIIPMARLNERIPANYAKFTAVGKNDNEEKASGFVNIDTKAVYIYDNNVIFSLPDYKVIVPPFGIYSNDLLQYDKFMRAIVRNTKLVNDDEFFCDFYDVDEQNNKMSVRIFQVASPNNKLVGTYLLNGYERTVTNISNKKIVYDDSKITKYKETYITEDKAGEMALSILKKLKKIDSNKKYIVTDVMYTKGDEETEFREGYFLTVRLDGDDRAEVVGHFFINNTSTVMMELYLVENTYYYIYGEFIPFG